MSLICCRKCDEPRCDGCNIYILAQALAATNSNLIVPRGTAKSLLYHEPKYSPAEFFSAERKNKHKE